MVKVGNKGLDRVCDCGEIEGGWAERNGGCEINKAWHQLDVGMRESREQSI